VWALEDLTQAAEPDRARILPIHGGELITVALDPLNASAAPAAQLRAMLDGEPVLPPMVDLIDQHITALRRLDDRQGGGALSLRYVTGQLRAVLGLVNGAAYTPAIGRRLQDAAANLAQLAGWLSFDAGANGAAQRFFFLGLRLAANRDCSTNILGMLTYTTAHTGNPADAVRLGLAAEQAARHLSVGMRARIAGRLATAHAAAGDLYAFRQAANQARILLGQRRPEDDPAALYYLSADQLAAETGQALIHLALRHPARARTLLNEAVELLAPLTSAGLRVDYQRSALLHGCFLALAQLHRADLEAACVAATTAVGRLPGVQSGRCRAFLRVLRAKFARRKRNVWAADTVQRLDQALLEA